MLCSYAIWSHSLIKKSDSKGIREKLKNTKSKILNSKKVSESILDLLFGPPLILTVHAPDPIALGMRGRIKEKLKFNIN